MKSSLDSLVKNLMGKDFVYLSEEYIGELLKLVKEKAVYGSLMSIWAVLKDLMKINCLISVKFFSSLKDKCISKKEYDRAINIWNVFKMKTLGKYHDLYLKADVLLLADVFEKFIKTYLDYYKLDPCHDFSSPGLSWDAMLKITGVELELISDINMKFFIEKGIRGGISSICKTPSKIEDCGSNKKKKKSIMYWDVNNLYCRGMNQPLPYAGFDWLSKQEINEIDLDSISENSTIGYLLEADLKYPSELHDSHNDYPLAPEKLEISSDMLSKYCSDIADKYGIKVGGVSKLVPNLRDKKNA